MSAFINQGNRLVGKCKKAATLHFAFILFAVVGSLQAVSTFAYIEGKIRASLALAVVITATMVAYYAIYVREYSSFLSQKRRRRFFYAIYNAWGIVAFSVVYIFTLSQLFHALNSYLFSAKLPTLLDNNPDYESVVKFLVYRAANSITFNYLATFSLDQWNMKPVSRLGMWFVFIFAAFYQTVFVAALVKEVKRFIAPRKFLLEPFETNPRNFKVSPQKITPILIQQIHQAVDSGSYSTNFEENVSIALLSINTPEVQDIYTRLLNDTDSQGIFIQSLNYFDKFGMDRRARTSIARIKATRCPKSAWLREWEQFRT